MKAASKTVISFCVIVIYDRLLPFFKLLNKFRTTVPYRGGKSILILNSILCVISQGILSIDISYESIFSQLVRTFNFNERDLNKTPVSGESIFLYLPLRHVYNVCCCHKWVKTKSKNIFYYLFKCQAFYFSRLYEENILHGRSTAGKKSVFQLKGERLNFARQQHYGTGKESKARYVIQIHSAFCSLLTFNITRDSRFTLIALTALY